MILYHVATNVFTTGQCTIYPRIPKSAAPDEDKKLPRICLSDSIEHCLEALLTKGETIDKNATICVYKAKISERDPYLLKPLAVSKYVPDALATHEY